MKLSVAAFLLLASAPTTAAFQPPQSLSSRVAAAAAATTAATTSAQQKQKQTTLFTTAKDDDKDKEENAAAAAAATPSWKRRIRPTTAALVTASALMGMHAKINNNNNNNMIAHASAPVMALPKAEDRDPITDAMMRQEKINQVQAQKELQQMAQQAREIEASQGEAARVRFEKEYKAQQHAQADAKAQGLVQLKRDLLDQGLDPFTDLEAKRQTVLYEKGFDLGEVSGTPFHLEKTLERTKPKRSLQVQKAIHRQVVKCVVQDLKNRNIDPLEYMEKHTEQTLRIMDMNAAQAAVLLQTYQANLEQYGQITVPKEGQVSAKEQMAATAAANQNPKAAKEAAKKAKAEQKAAEKAEKARIKAEQKAAKEAAKKEKQAAKEAAKKEKQAAKAAAATAAAAAGAATAATAAGTAAMDATASPQQPPAQMEQVMMGSDGGTATTTTDQSTAVATTTTEQEATAATSQQKTKNLPIVPVSAAFVAVGGGGYAFKLYRDKAAEDEAERQRQFKLLMEGEADTTAPPLEVIPEDEESSSNAKAETTTTSAAEETPTSEPPKKKRLGIKKVFGKKKNDRETDLSVVVGSEAKAPEFALTLAKILTYGAPGRFPNVVQLPGDMPMDSNKFDLEQAKSILSSQREASGLTLEESAEVFANVVNCMLIDIVDLASAALKEKDDDIVVKSINIVVDFMNHAASLYDSIAKDVVIKPVTYGGDLSKSKLEQMYSTYTVSGMMGMFGGGGESKGGPADDFDNRVALLQDVFQISEKKAEGLMMKAVQKNMMEMMKDEKSMEGMEDMLGDMGDLSGLAGMEGMEDGEGPSTEQLKEMLTSLKAMKDSGSIPPSEFEQVKDQFKEAFGSSLDEVVKDASTEGELSTTEQELLDLMKAIMDD